MTITRPYYRTVRPFVDGEYAEGGRSEYVGFPGYAPDASDYVRGYLLLQKDLLTLFEYVDPADQNRDSYSLRTYELLLRICTEVEANFKSIMRANGYRATGNLNMKDYWKVNGSHFLSQYEVKYPYWKGNESMRRPFATWHAKQSYVPVPWYQAYNNSKHDRGLNLQQATFEHLVDAMSALVVLLAAQFYTHDFGPANGVLMVENNAGDTTEGAIGGYMRVKYPDTVPQQERYDFTHADIVGAGFALQQYDYNK